MRSALVVLLLVASPALAQKTPAPGAETSTPKATATFTPTATSGTPTATATKTPRATPTQKPAPTVVKGTVDQRVSVISSDLATKQEAYRLAHGRYFQGLETMPTPPADGETAAPVLNTKPGYQAETWADMALPITAAEPAQYAVDNYDGPRGQGWVLRTRVTINGLDQCKAENHGPESRFGYDWTPCPVEVP